jgi:putative ABC transport system permease protein
LPTNPRPASIRVTADQVLDLMRERGHAEGAAFIIATHDDRLTRRCDRIVALRDGRITGTPAPTRGGRMNARWLKFAWQNACATAAAPLVTVSIAALGTAAILLAGGFALFTYQALAQSAARGTGHLVVAKAEQFTKEEDTPLQNGLDDAAALKARLLADADVRQVLPRVEFTGLISNGDKSTVMMAVGVDPDAEFAVKGPFLTVKAGDVLSEQRGPRSQREVMLGEGLARSLKAKPGSSLTLLSSTTDGALNALDVRVKGVFSTGIPEMDKRLVYTDVLTAQKLLNTQRISSLGVFLRNRMDLNAGGPAARGRRAAAAARCRPGKTRPPSTAACATCMTASSARWA